MPEISDEKLALLEGAYDLLSKLERHKDTTRSFHSLVKKIRPDTQTPEDIAAPFVEELNGKIEALSKQITERFTKEDTSREDRELNDIWSKLKNDGMTDEAKAEVGKLMKDRKIGDPEAAFALYRKMNPPAEPLPNIPGDSRWGDFSLRGFGKDNELLFTDADAWARQEAAKVQQELKTQRAA